MATDIKTPSVPGSGERLLPQEVNFLRALFRNDQDPQALGTPALRQLARLPGLAAALVGESPPPALELELANHPLLWALLRRTVVAHPGLEAWLIGLRQRGFRCFRPSRGLQRALAHQGWNNQYLWSDAAEPDWPSSAPRLWRAAYAPEGGESERIWRQRVLWEPAWEARLAPTIPRLSPPLDAVSERVAEQYEGLPFPRYLGYPRWPSATVESHLSRLFPRRRWALPPHPPVLIAGCGTGRHALSAATRYRARVLGIDLSRASLAFARRVAERDGWRHLDLAQADLRDLASWPGRFGVIECVGVLHHLADPEAGLAALLSRLERGGAIRLGLYSRMGRAAVAAARVELALRGWTEAHLAQARRHLLGLPRQHPAYAATTYVDFYSRSGARDLLFPAWEQVFDLLEVQRLLHRLDLEFLGFEEPRPGVLQAFDRLFGEGRRGCLEDWHRWEGLYPRTFRGMYVFWCALR